MSKPVEHMSKPVEHMSKPVEHMTKPVERSRDHVRSRMRTAAAWVGVALMLAVTVSLVGWRLHGGRWVRVETASMGTEAPVGTLLWVAPADFDELRPGDLVTFHPPGDRSVTYSHLVKSVNSDGTLATQGRISAPDPWRIGREEMVGKVVMRWPGVGWLVLAAPVLVLGGLLVLLVVRRMRSRDLRLPVAVVGGSLVIVLALVVYRPLTRAEQLSFVPAENGARATYVSTGLLPLRLSAHGAEPVVLSDGEVGSVLTPGHERTEGGSRFAVSLRPHIPLGWWAALVAACFVPALARPATRVLRRTRARTSPFETVAVRARQEPRVSRRHSAAT